MRLENKKHQKVMEMQIKDNLLELRPNKGLGIFDFSMREKDLLKLLNQINQAKYTTTRKDQTVIYDCSFYDINMLFFFHYNKRGIEYMTIHTSNLILNHIEVKSKKMDEMIKLAKDFHSIHLKKFKYTYVDNEDEIFLHFENIGMTVWFEQDIISDISVGQEC